MERALDEALLLKYPIAALQPEDPVAMLEAKAHELFRDEISQARLRDTELIALI